MHARLIALVALLATPVWASDRRAADRIYDQGLRAEFAGDYVRARDAFDKVLRQARAAGLGPEYVSAATYDLARMTGYTCDFVRAKELLLEALSLEQALPAPGPGNVTKRLSELARLSYDQGNFAESAAYYERVVPELERLGVLKLDPNGFANLLDDHAIAVSRSGDEQRAGSIRAKAGDVRSKNAGVPVRFSPVYYRDACVKK
ncbi:hypothetical protein [Ramlibacter sp. WS9]|uniref:hypothetical protein n=1 Tax=Ramlibacter sp. WS9 TaxID=1882741 RepID=UPI001142E63A|nr:hypothetical protein [Ramlibacter sp. WS9]